MIDPNQLLAVVGIVSAIGGAGVTAGATRQRVKAVEAKVEQHDKRTQGFDARLARIETDISWIRKSMESK
jgi:hypothetical protein